MVLSAACAGKPVLTGEAFAKGGSPELYHEGASKAAGWRVVWSEEVRGRRPWSLSGNDE